MTNFRRELDNQGCCNSWQHGIRTINGQYPDDNRDFDIVAGDGIEVSPATAGIEISVKAPLPGPMVYRGTVGTGGTVASLPDANVENIGWTYVTVSAGSTPDDTPKTYQIGDLLISNGEEWTVVAAGDDPYVTLDTAQTITGKKTHTGDVEYKTNVDQATPTNINWNAFCITDKNNVIISGFRGSQSNTGYLRNGIQIRRNNSITANLQVCDDNGELYVTVPSRAYNSANTNDIVTIGSLASNPDVVHTTGNETLSGTKVFLSTPFIKSTDIKPSDTSQTTTKWLNTYFIRGSDNNILGGIEYGMKTTGNRVIRLRLAKADGTYAYKTLFEIDNAGNVIV